MSLKDQMKAMELGVLAPNKPSTAAINKAPDQLGANPKGHTSMTAPGELAKFSKEFQALESEVESLRTQQGLPATIALSQLHRSPYQTRRLDEIRVAELMENLRHNPLTTPISARLIKPGYYEIVAGHHRVEAFFRLGRTEMPVSVVTLTDSEARRLVFYDNLLAPSITDYEKFKGFNEIKKSEGLTNEDLAIQSGISESLVGMIMSFSRLPEQVFPILDQFPSSVGSALVSKLCTLPESVSDRIVEAVTRISDGRLTQANAIEWIKGAETKVKTPWITVKSGRLKFAEVARRDRQVTIRFANQEDAEAIQADLMDILKLRASSQK